MTYRIFFHHGPELGLSTHVEKGTLDVVGDSIVFSSSGSLTRVPIKTISAISMFRLHGLSRVVRVEHDAGSTFFAVTRIMIGQFAFVNFFKTGTLFTQIQAMVCDAAA